MASPDQALTAHHAPCIPAHYSLTGRRVVVLANPRAGASSSRAHVDELAAALVQRGLQAEVCWQREAFSAAVAGGGAADIRCVVAAGGDGTLVEVLNRAPGRPVALLPLGTENLVARFWRIERSGRMLAEVIAAGACRTLDLARLEAVGEAGPVRRLFCLMAGAGFDADVVHRLHRRRHGHINQSSYIWPIVKALRHYGWPPIDVEIPETGERLRGATVLVFNLPQYGMGLPVAPEARGDDGWLDLCVFGRPGMFNLLRYLADIVRGRRDRIRDLHRRRVRAVRLTSATPARLQTDGDPAGSLPARIEVVPAALTLVVPP
jgi:diacylglycerol kinase family enzyme